MPSSSPRSTFLILGTVVLMIGLQIVAKYLPGGNSLKREKPGPTRGDLVLTEDALPAELAGWTRTKFIPAPPVDELPEGQYWWVHQWQYQKDGTTALVSFDQLGEDQWHELTYCYRILDWVIDDRTIRTDATSAGKYVLAQMSKEDGQQGLLVFSVFFENGKWDLPPDFELSLLNAYTSDLGLTDRMAGRFQQPDVPQAGTTRDKTEARRALQCQVFVSSLNPDTPSQLEPAIQLHLESRRHFRSDWLENRNSQSEPRTTAN